MLTALLANIQVLAKTSCPKKTVFKEPYFDKKWRNRSAFEKTVDKNTDWINTQNEVAQVHDQILVMFKTAKNAGSGRNTFLKKLAVDSITSSRSNRTSWQKQAKKKSSVKIQWL